MRRVIGIDIHRTFGEVVIWEEGVVRHFGRVDMTRTALEGLERKSSCRASRKLHCAPKEASGLVMACKIAREQTVAGSQVNAGVTQVRGARSTANPDLRHDTFDHRLNRSCTDTSRPISERKIPTLKVYWRPGCIVQLSPSGEARGTATWSGPILTRLAISAPFSRSTTPMSYWPCKSSQKCVLLPK